VNHEHKIILPLHPVTFRGRRIRSGEIYKLPDMQSNPIEIAKDGLSDLFSESDLDLVKTLATRLNMGGVIAEEVCSYSGIDKKTVCQDLSDEMVETVHRGIAHVFGQIANLKPHTFRSKFPDIRIRQNDISVRLAGHSTSSLAQLRKSRQSKRNLRGSRTRLNTG